MSEREVVDTSAADTANEVAALRIFSMKRTIALIERLAAERDRAEAERDEARAVRTRFWQAALGAMRERDKAQALLAEAAGALEPFAARAATFEPDWTDEQCHWHPAVGSPVTVGHHSTARAVRDKIKGVG